MSEKLVFHFEGALADGHQMNFYEASRFQYAAARLLVKLSKFREKGSFPHKISSKSNVDVRLSSSTDGSFNINVEDFGKKQESGGQFIEAPIGDLIAYITERVVEKIGDDGVKNSITESKSLILSEVDINNIAGQVVSGSIYVEQLPESFRDLIRRRIVEINREARLVDSGSAISKMDFAKGQSLLAMSAPLIAEMATALRSSADTLEITSSAHGKSKPILFLDQNMAAKIETASVDKVITPILCDVVQFNKDNGWGKVKIEDGAVTLSFNIPYDKLQSIRQRLIDNMKRDHVYLQTYFVRDRAGKVTRLIVVGILDTPTS